MRKLGFASLLMLTFCCVVFAQVPEYNIDSKVLQDVKDRTIDVRVKTQDEDYVVKGVILSTGYVISNSHISPGRDQKFKIIINHKEAQILWRIPASADFILLKAETGEFAPVQLNMDFKVGDVVFSLGRNYRISYGPIIFVHSTEFFLFADLITKPGDSGSGVWSLDGRFIGLRSGYPLIINGKKVPSKTKLADIRSTSIRIKKILDELNFSFLYK